LNASKRPGEAFGMAMSRVLLAAVLACLCGVPALADCADEANLARERTWTSGPFGFESTRWGKNFRLRTCGEIDPGNAQRERSCDSAARPNREKVWIGTQRWENDGFGWQGPYATIWTHQEKLPAAGVSFQSNQITCFGRVIVEGRELNRYEFATRLADRTVAETVFTDTETGLPVRFETKGRTDTASGSVMTFRHDASIRIEPPAVDLSARWSASLQHVAQEARKGDPACRAGFLAVMERAKAAAFHYEIKGAFDSYPCCMIGTFVPADSLHYQIEQMLGSRVAEVIAVGTRAWINKSSPEKWTEVNRGRDEANRIIDSLLPPSDHVGHVRCLGKVTADVGDYDAYEFDFYRDRESARKFDGNRYMLVDQVTGLPYQTTHMSRTRVRRWVETRRYDLQLAVQDPAIVLRQFLPASRPLGGLW
jgi:hypothetical protein